MPLRKLEAQPHYQEVIMDSRIVELMATMAIAEKNRQEEKRRQRLFPPPSTEEIAALERSKPPLVNDIEHLASPGRDGEDYSGGIDFMKVTTPQGEETAAIRSFQFAHSTGLPPEGNSWSAEFRDLDLAEQFWGKKWKPHFAINHFLEALGAFIEERQIPEDVVSVNALGLLYPWYLQHETDFRFLDLYSTKGNSIVHLPSQLPASALYNVGQVYRVPVADWFTVDPRAVESKTCLAAVEFTQSRSFMGRQAIDYTAIQWEDGPLAYYRHDVPTLLPTPATRKDFVRGIATIPDSTIEQ